MAAVPNFTVQKINLAFVQLSATHYNSVIVYTIDSRIKSIRDVIQLENLLGTCTPKWRYIKFMTFRVILKTYMKPLYTEAA